MALAAYADVPAPVTIMYCSSIGGHTFRAFSARSRVVGHNSGCWRISESVSAPATERLAPVIGMLDFMYDASGFLSD
jgi:hypothetical protein